MYREFFDFKEHPFTITPNTRFIYFSANHREAFAHLFYGVTNRAGFIELTGEVGAGKTTVIRALLNRLDEERYRTALILNPCLSGLGLMRGINREFGLRCEDLDGSELLHELNLFLLEESEAGRTVVLVIDEAQNLTPQVLEQVRLISNLETETAKLIQIVLAGQPELGALLERTDLRQLSQRIAVRYHLRPMDSSETSAYIFHRLDIAGGRFAVRFTPWALRRIHRFSRGLPRLINILCDRSLLVAFGDARRVVSGKTVSTAIREIRREPGFSVPFRGGRPALFFVLLLILATALYLYLRDLSGTAFSALPAGVGGSGSVVSGTVPAMPLFTDPSITTEAENSRQAFAVLARLWGAPAPASAPERGGEAALRRMAGDSGLKLYSLRTGLDYLLHLDVPVLLEVRIPGVRGKRCMVLTGATEEGLFVAPHMKGQASLSRKKLETLWTGRLYLLLRNSRDIPLILSPGAAGKGVLAVRRMLEENGFPQTGRGDVFDASMTAALKDFQRNRGIIPDGKLGPVTLLLLYRGVGEAEVPRLEKGRKGRSE